jgi:hypothetical protein
MTLLRCGLTGLEIARLARSFLTNRGVPETNFPLKNLDGPPQGVKPALASGL